MLQNNPSLREKMHKNHPSMRENMQDYCFFACFLLCFRSMDCELTHNLKLML